MTSDWHLFHAFIVLVLLVALGIFIACATSDRDLHHVLVLIILIVLVPITIVTSMGACIVFVVREGVDDELVHFVVVVVIELSFFGVGACLRWLYSARFDWGFL